MFESFIELFAYMDPIVYVLFIIGIVCVVCEMLTPGLGFFGIMGIICLVAGIVIRMVGGGDIYMLMYMVVFAAILLTVLFIMMTRSAKKGWLSKTSLFNIGTSVPTGITEGTKDFSDLVGQKGEAITLLRPIGQVKFADEIFDASAQQGVIESGTIVICVEVEGQRIVVKKA